MKNENLTDWRTESRPVAIFSFFVFLVLMVSGTRSSYAGTAASIALGGAHTCAVTDAAGLKCWGRGGFGQLGNGSAANRTAPVDVTGLTSGVATVDAGTAHTCAVTTAGAVLCWGDGRNGRLGNGSTVARFTPVGVTGLSAGVADVALGKEHTCALMLNGGVKCWGSGANGRLGNNASTQSNIPVDVHADGAGGVLSNVIAIVAGDFHTCALVATVSLFRGRVQCWGANDGGQLGDGTSGSLNSRDHPDDICTEGTCSGDGLSDVRGIAAGLNHTCAITVFRNVVCWGSRLLGALGDEMGGGIRTFADPVCVGFPTCIPISNVDEISASFRHTCILTESGGGKCWGANGAGELGNGSFGTKFSPVDVVDAFGTPLTGLGSIKIGGGHMCALTMAGSITCYGGNSDGQLGNGTTVNSLLPVDVVGFEPGSGGSDSDGDGIDDAIDGTFNGGFFTDESSFFSNNFTDQHQGGTSFGFIIDRADLDITVTDVAFPAGLKVEASVGVGTISFINLCGFVVSLTAGDVLGVNCASLTMEVVTGPVEINLGENEDTVVTVPEGATVKITETDGKFRIENLSDIDITVTTAGQEITIGSGQVNGTCDCGALGAIVGTNGFDFLLGTRGDDTICGLGGSDVIIGRSGNDCIDAGPGNDFVYGRRGGDTIFGREGNDVILGNRGNDTITGDKGRDRLFGGSGDDEIDGGDGKDLIIGGRGTDQCTNGEHTSRCETP